LCLVDLDVKINPITTTKPGYRRPQRRETNGTADQKAQKSHSWVLLVTLMGLWMSWDVKDQFVAAGALRLSTMSKHSI